MAISHVFSSPIADFTGTVVVYDSAGQTATGAASDIVKPSDWNSAHNQYMTISGNTAGASTLSGTNLVLQGGSNVTLSANGQTLIFHGNSGGGASQMTAYATANTTLSTSGTIAQSAFNVAGYGGVSAGISNGSLVIAGPPTSSLNISGALSASSNGSTINLGVGTVSATATGNTTQASSGTLNLNALVVNGVGGVSAGISNGSLVISGATGGGAGGAAISAAGGSQNTGTVIFSNSNGVSFGYNAGTITATVNPGAAAGIAAIADSAQTATSGTIVFSNSNNITFGMSGSTRITASASYPAQTNQTGNFYVTANSTQLSSTAGIDHRSLSFAGAGNVSVGVSQGVVVISATGGGGGIALANSETTYTSGTAQMSVAGGAMTIASTTGQKFNFSVPATSSLVAGANITISTGGSTITIIAGTAAPSPMVFSAGASSASLNSVVFSNSNGISFGLNGSTVTGSHNALTQQSTQPVAFSAGAASSNFSTLQFQDSNGISWSNNAGSIRVTHDLQYTSATSAITSNAFPSANTTKFAGTGTTITGNALITLDSLGLKFNGTSLAGISTGSAGANVGISMTHNSSGLNLSITTPAQSVQPMYYSASGTSSSSGTIQFGNTQGVSFSLSNGSIVGTVKTDYQSSNANYLTSQSNQAFSAGAAQSNFQTLIFQDSNGVSWSNNAGSIRVTHDLQYTSATSAITSNALNTSASRVINIVAATNNTGGGAASQSGNVSFTNANGATFYTSAGGAVALSYSVPAAGGMALSVSGGNRTSGGGGYVNITSGTLQLLGGNNITLSQDGSSITISGANVGGAQTGISGIVANGGTFSSGSVYFSNLGNISISTSANGASQYVQLSGNAAQTTQPVAFSAGAASSNFSTLQFQDSNGVSWSNNAGSIRVTHDLQYTSATSAITSNALNTSASRVINIVAATNNTGGGTASLSSNVSFSNANGLTFYTSAGGAVVGSYSVPTQTVQPVAFSASGGSSAFSTLSFVSGSNVNWTNSNGGVQMLHSLAGTSTGTAGNNIGLSMTLNSSGLNLSATVAAQSVQPVAWSGSGGSSNFSTLNFSNASNISFSNSNGSIQVVHNLAGTSTGSAGANVGISMTHNSSGLNLSITTPTQTNQTGNLYVTANSTQLSSTAGVDLRSISFAGAGNISVGVSQGVVVISQTGGAGGGIAASLSGNSTSGGAGYSNITSGTMILAGGPNITLSQDGSRISISGNAPGAAAENNWVNLLGANTAGNTTASGSTLGFSGVNMTLSGTNNSQIVMSVPAVSSLVGVSGISISSNGSTISVYQPAMSYLPTPLAVMYTTQSVAAHMQSTSQVFPIYVPENLSFNYIRMLQSLSISSMASLATTANFTQTVLSQAGTFNFVLYSRGVGANSLSLQSIGSTQHTSGLNVVVTANANGSQWTMSNNFSFPNSATASTGYTTGYATTLSNLNASSTHLASINGVQFMEFPWASSLLAGNYWMAIGLTTGALTTAQSASYSRFSVAQSFIGAPQTNLVFSQLGSGGAASIQAQFGVGSFTTAGGGTTGSMPISAISSQASHIVPWVTFARIA